MRFLFVSILLVLPFALIGQTANYPLNQKSSSDLSDIFSNYTGVGFSEDDLLTLEGQVSRLDSVDADASIIGSYLLMDSVKFVNYLTSQSDAESQISLGYRVSRQSGDVFAFAICKKGGYSVSENSSLSLSVQNAIQDFLRSHGGDIEMLPDAMARGIDVYIGYMSGLLEDASLTSAENPTDDLVFGTTAKNNSEEEEPEHIRNPYLETTREQTFLSVSGVPIMIPDGAFVRFYPVGHKFQFCLKSFSLNRENNVNVYRALQFVSGHEYAGLFSGYGYLPPKQNPYDIGEEQKPHVKYSYKDYVTVPQTENLPPYSLGREIGVTYGVIYPCATGRPSARYYTRSLSREVDVVDLSDPITSPNHPLSFTEGKRYYSINQKLTQQLSFENGIPTAVNWDPVLSQSVSVNTNLDVSGSYSCIVDSLLKTPVLAQMLDRGISYVIKLNNGSIVSIVRHGGRLYYAYDLDPSTPTVDYMMHHPSSGWVNVEISEDNTVNTIFKSAFYVGKILAIGAAVGVTIIAPVGIGYGAGLLIYGTAAAIPETALTLLILGGEVTVAFAESYVESYITGQEVGPILARNLVIVVGAEVLGAAIPLTKILEDFIDFRNGERIINGRVVSDELDHVITILDEAGEVVARRNLNRLAQEMKDELSMSNTDIVKAIREWSENPNVAEFILKSDGFTGVRAWKAVSTAPLVIRTNLSVLESMRKLIQHDLIKNVGDATSNQLANIHKYTALGDYLNEPMRVPITNAIEFSDLTLPRFEYQSYRAIVEGLQRLRQTSRLETGVVFRGRPLSDLDYQRLFGDGSPQDIPVKGFVSTTKNREVAETFANMGDFTTLKYRMIWKIKSKNGVNINDLSDWGENLGSIYHASAMPPVIRNQQEVLLEEGFFRKTSVPTAILENGSPKVTYNGAGDPVYWMEVELEELGISIRQITGE